jgi:hypothetical protein
LVLGKFQKRTYSLGGWGKKGVGSISVFKKPSIFQVHLLLHTRTLPKASPPQPKAPSSFWSQSFQGTTMKLSSSFDKSTVGGSGGLGGVSQSS